MGCLPNIFKKKSASDPPVSPEPPSSRPTPYTKPNTTVPRLTLADRTLHQCLPISYEKRFFNEPSQIFPGEVDRERFFEMVKIVLSQNGTERIDTCRIDLYFPRESWESDPRVHRSHHSPRLRATFTVSHPEFGQIYSSFSAAKPGTGEEEAFRCLMVTVEARFHELVSRKGIAMHRNGRGEGSSRGRQMGLEGGSLVATPRDRRNDATFNGGLSSLPKRRNAVKGLVGGPASGERREGR